MSRDGGGSGKTNERPGPGPVRSACPPTRPGGARPVRASSDDADHPRFTDRGRRRDIRKVLAGGATPEDERRPRVGVLACYADDFPTLSAGAPVPAPCPRIRTHLPQHVIVQRMDATSGAAGRAAVRVPARDAPGPPPSSESQAAGRCRRDATIRARTHDQDGRLAPRGLPVDRRPVDPATPRGDHRGGRVATTP